MAGRVWRIFLTLLAVFSPARCVHAQGITEAQGTAIINLLDGIEFIMDPVNSGYMGYQIKHMDEIANRVELNLGNYAYDDFGKPITYGHLQRLVEYMTGGLNTTIASGDVLKTRLSTMGDSLTTMNTAIAAINTNVSDIEGYVDTLETKVQQTNTTLSSVDSWVGGIKGALMNEASGEEWLSRIDANVLALKEVVTRVAGGVESTESIHDVLTVLEEIKDNTGIEGVLYAQLGLIQDQLVLMTSYDSNLQQIRTSVGLIQTAVSSINTTLGTMSGTLTTLNSNASTISTRATSIDTKLTTTNTRLQSIDDSASNIEDAITAPTTGMKAVLAHLDTNAQYLKDKMQTLTTETFPEWRAEILQGFSDQAGYLAEILQALQDMTVQLPEGVEATLEAIKTDADSMVSLLTTMNAREADYLPELPLITDGLAYMAPKLDAVAEAVNLIRVDTSYMAEFFPEFNNGLAWLPEIAASLDEIKEALSDDVTMDPVIGGLNHEALDDNTLFQSGDRSVPEFMSDEADTATGMISNPFTLSLTQTDTPPVWTLQLNLTEWFSGTGWLGLRNYTLHVDWSFWTPFRTIAWAIMITFVTLNTASMVWEEVRKYG